MTSFSLLFKLFLKNQLVKSRLVAPVALSVVAIGLSILIATQSSDDIRLVDSTFFLFTYGLALLIPITSLLVASGVFGQLLEDETLVYLWLSPVKRFTIAAAAILASTLVAFAVSGVSLTISAFIASGEVSVAIDALIASILGTLAYSALFSFLGLLTKYSTIWGLLFIFLWENVITGLFDAGSGTIANASVSYHARSIIGSFADSQPGNEISESIDLASPVAASITLLVMAGLFTWINSLRLAKMEIA